MRAARLQALGFSYVSYRLNYFKGVFIGDYYRGY